MSYPCESQSTIKKKFCKKTLRMHSFHIVDVIYGLCRALTDVTSLVLFFTSDLIFLYHDFYLACSSYIFCTHLLFINVHRYCCIIH